MQTIAVKVILLLAVAGSMTLADERGDEKSVRPGINDSFRDPDPKQFVERFEIESREVFAKRKEIVQALNLKPADVVADIGAGTGLFTRLFARELGPDGRVIAVDIAQKFLDHIEVTCREQGIRNVETLRCRDNSTELPAESVDVAFICDTYHHFEFPLSTMTSLRKALKPGGRLFLIDFHRIEGTSSDWTMEHVRAGQEVFEAEILKAGFVRQREVTDLLQENYLLEFAVAEHQQAEHQGDVRPVGPGGRGRGFMAGRGRGAGPDPDMRADQEVFHALLEQHTKIRRNVRNLKDGVETLTESDDPEVAALIQEHVAAMHRRVTEGRGLRFWDELFVAVFRDYKQIRMVVETTDHGVKVTETSDNPTVARLIQAHAVVVSRFVERGFDEAHENHPVPVDPPAGKPVTAELEFPVIVGFGGVARVPDAVELPRSGVKLVLDVTAASSSPEQASKGLDRAARVVNLYGLAGLSPNDLKITVVLHGEATESVLTDSAWKSRFPTAANPNLPLIDQLRNAGVEVLVCGQALHYRKVQREEVHSNVPVAMSAVTVLLNRQSDGFSLVTVP